jgi:hypothetical protein
MAINVVGNMHSALDYRNGFSLLDLAFTRCPRHLHIVAELIPYFSYEA